MSACRHCGADLGETARHHCNATCRAAETRERDAAKARRDLEAALRAVVQYDGETVARAIVARVLKKRGRGRPKVDQLAKIEALAEAWLREPTLITNRKQWYLADRAGLLPGEASELLRDPRFLQACAQQIGDARASMRKEKMRRLERRRECRRQKVSLIRPN
jgi:hypothetical protein